MGCMLESLGMTHILVLATTTLALAIVWFLVLPLAHWKRKGIPHVPAVPIFGSIADSFLQRKSLADDHRRIYQLMEGNRYAGFHKLVKPAIMIRDPEILKDILVKDFSSFHDNDFDVTPEMDPIMGRSLFFMHGELWKRVRSSLSPAFSSGKIKSVMPLIQNVSEDLRAYLEEEGDKDVELKELCGRFTTNVVASCVFGIETDSLRRPDEEFRKMGYMMMEPTPARALAQLLIMDAPRVARILRVLFIPRVVADFFRQVVRDIAKGREKNGETRNDFLNMLLILKGEGKLGVREEKERAANADVLDRQKDTKDLNFGRIVADPESLDDVTAQAIGFFLDGSETSSTLISFTLFELAHNPDVQERLREEILDVMGNHEEGEAFEALQKMTYLDMVVKESARKYPPAPFLARRCTKRYHFPAPNESIPKDVGGFWVEPGTPMIVPIYALHRDPKHFPNPEVFDPERFSKEGRDGRSLSYIPFGEGPRMCIGNRFGVTQSKAAVAHVVSHFKLSPCDEKSALPIELDPNSILLLSKNKLWVKIERIKST